jgi:hypothetical protein
MAALVGFRRDGKYILWFAGGLFLTTRQLLLKDERDIVAVEQTGDIQEWDNHFVQLSLPKKLTLNVTMQGELYRLDFGPFPGMKPGPTIGKLRHIEDCRSWLEQQLAYLEAAEELGITDENAQLFRRGWESYLAGESNPEDESNQQGWLAADKYLPRVDVLSVVA